MREQAVGDDALITKTFAARCAHRANSTYTLAGMNVPRVGDVIRAWNPANGAALPAHGTVLVAKGSWGAVTVRFAKPLEGVVCDSNHGDPVNSTGMQPGFLFINDNLTGYRHTRICRYLSLCS